MNNRERMMQHLINDHEAFVESVLYVCDKFS
jgi:hypothetical protein